MEELTYYILFLFAWIFFQSLWIGKLAKQVKALEERLGAQERD